MTEKDFAGKLAASLRRARQSASAVTTFAGLARDCPLPVYAFGGMRRELFDTAMRHGAHGIAMHSGVW